jgi:hypothetical protein
VKGTDTTGRETTDWISEEQESEHLGGTAGNRRGSRLQDRRLRGKESEEKTLWIQRATFLDDIYKTRFSRLQQRGYTDSRVGIIPH